MIGAYYFTTRSGERKFGYIIRRYAAFEGGMRYIFRVDGDRNYHCVRTEEGYKEYVA